MIKKAEEGYFGLENGGISGFAPWQLLPAISIVNC